MSDIYNIINKEKLDIVSKPIKDAHGLPNECYTSKEYTLIERKKLFEDKWMVIGVASSLPNVGDAKPVDILGMPILLVRGKDKKIRVFHNVCSHRGLKLVTKPGNIKNVIRCPYHSWSYNFDGELVATPHIGGMNIHQTKDFERSKSNLKEIRSYIWLDLIMININNNEMSFEEYIKPLSDRWEEFWPIKDRELINHSNDFGYFKLNANCNWKFAIENYCESYHLPWVHPGLNSYSKIEDHYHIQGLPNRFAGQGTVVYNPRFEGKEKFPCFPNWPKNKENIAEYVALFPNVMLGIHKDHYYAYWLEPINHEFTLEHMELYYVGEEAANSKKFESLRKQNHKQWEDIQKEDVDIIQGMQIGRNSPVYNGGNFSPVMDNPTHHFHKWVAQNLI
ncbi:aromatic ring-hydroxylating oxygenase subunit alpha [Candidatus Pelagibacter communis]|uniref:aromatic ring-hydroxylating oxygenase subunit alpha n=1 Tax=Pelagibacter ubique TaxID=198252 RepID=UPI00094D607F|nr:aromatic ring-hydroxylating dioxygenase subunit alpha [Candidatus Pelagibacter ubique]|tara:strand:- start:926 stop:2101 length:1176 start_codon:yes stop_codon:yes gene_type:complete